MPYGRGPAAHASQVGVSRAYEAGIQLRVAGLRPAHPDGPTERLEFEAPRSSLLHAGT